MTDPLLDHLAAICGAANVLSGPDAAPFGQEPTGQYRWTPRAVVRPGSTADVSAVMRVLQAASVPVVPLGGGSGLTGATAAEGAVMLSLTRLNRIRAINPQARTATVEAGVVLQSLHEALEDRGLSFPLWFGARGTAQIGGCLATNAGGSNVLRYGNARALCLGVEAVLPDGRVMDLLSGLHKDNSGYDLRDLLIGSEGTLAIITAATLKLQPRPRARATAAIALPGLAPALDLLNTLQESTGGMVEAFEYMPDLYMHRLAEHRPDLRPPFDPFPPVTILLELASTQEADAVPDAEGRMPLARRLEDLLERMLANGQISDAIPAGSEARRRAFWAVREAAAEITLTCEPLVDTDIAVPLDAVEPFLRAMSARLQRLDPGAGEMVVAHLGDGNVHYTAYPTRADAGLDEAIREAVEDEALRLGGSFSAEHGIGLSKLGAMRRHKDPVALKMMRGIKRVFDPSGILNPGKTLP